MTRIFEYGSSTFDGVRTIDIHDKEIPLIERAEFLLFHTGACCCDDFLCTDEELALAMNQLEKRDLH